MDDSDRATAQEEVARMAAIAARKPEPQLESGRCAYCDELTPGRWCNQYCREDWQREQEADKRNGV